MVLPGCNGDGSRNTLIQGVQVKGVGLACAVWCCHDYLTDASLLPPMSRIPPVSLPRRRMLWRLGALAAASHASVTHGARAVDSVSALAVCPESNKRLASVNPPLAALDITDREHPLFISAAIRSENESLLAVFSERADLQLIHPLPSRAHGAACHRSSGRVAVFSRRPGVTLHTFNVACPEHIRSTEAPADRHFYGHGAFSADGRRLYATENDFDHARGVLGVYDATRNYQRVGEIDTGGIGPHDVVPIPGTSWIVVANGGIRTHPDTGRDKLNLDAMEPSLVVLDTRDGQMLARFTLPDHLHQLSIRHLALAPAGPQGWDIWFAGQYQSDTHTAPALAGVLSWSGSTLDTVSRPARAAIRLINLPEALMNRVQNYLSSIAISGDQVVFTSAPGGVAFSLHRHTHELFETIDLLDCAGVADTGRASGSSDFLLTSGTGKVLRISDEGSLLSSAPHLRWDNHLYRL